MRYVLYAIEEYVEDNPNKWELINRYDETGDGSPLTWPTEEAAQEFMDALVEDMDWDDGYADELRIVMLTGENTP